MSLDELRDLLERHWRPGGATALADVRICRGGTGASVLSGAVLAVVVEGEKRIALDDRVHDYGTGQYLIASADLPVAGHFVDAGPTLGFGLTLRPAAIAELVVRGEVRDVPPAVRTAVSAVPDDLLDAIVRLLRLLDRPRDRKALAPLYRREILWRLLTGEQSDLVRAIGLADNGLAHIRRAVRWIRENYAEPFRIEDVARLSGMSVSAFHRNFQAVTAMTPIGFRTQLRLSAARLLLADRSDDVTGIGLRVGYDSPSQFSRDYRRRFGAPPSVDGARLRAGEVG
ncbi:AraC family transcriptional regulator N-terminal domain-containing protein [Umezawaea sp. NPDC059074]|uniref:AraC family transcriptional regulator n=1 Tax=Umezawaea sp. NPDC059074 TaxID=3346716 RepID=UPI0036C2377C